MQQPRERPRNRQRRCLPASGRAPFPPRRLAGSRHRWNARCPSRALSSPIRHGLRGRTAMARGLPWVHRRVPSSPLHFTSRGDALTSPSRQRRLRTPGRGLTTGCRGGGGGPHACVDEFFRRHVVLASVPSVGALDEVLRCLAFSTTTMVLARWLCALRIRPPRLPPRRTSTLRPRRIIRRATPSAARSWASLTGRTAACTGASQSGKRPW